MVSNPSMHSFLKNLAVRILERHPYGYLLGVILLEKCDFLLPHESDYFGFQELFRRGYGRSHSILDVGANRGHSARAFLRLLPGWTVQSIEANKMHEPFLAKIEKKNPNNFKYLINAAAEISGREITIFTPTYGKVALHSASSLSMEEALNAVESGYPHLKGKFGVRTTVSMSLAIDDLNLPVDFVKLDIQGAELLALRGMKDTIDKFEPILLIEHNAITDKIIGEFFSGSYGAWSFNSDSRKFTNQIQTGNFGHRNIFLAPRSLSHCF